MLLLGEIPKLRGLTNALFSPPGAAGFTLACRFWSSDNDFGQLLATDEDQVFFHHLVL
jgi:hypothetical protein